jgi:amino acid adenylation domain-containing protein
MKLNKNETDYSSTSAQNKVRQTSKHFIQDTDDAAQQRNWLQDEVLEQQLAYWIKKLVGTPALLGLPTDFPRPSVMSYQGKHLQSRLEPELTERIKQFSQQHNVTVFMTFLAAFKVLLYRYSGQTDLVVGSPIANHTHDQTEDLIDTFANTLVLRSQIQGVQTFSELLKQVGQTALEAYSHQDIPFEYLVEQLNFSSSLNYSPLFQVMLSLQDTPSVSLESSRLTVSLLEQEHKTAKVDLFLNMTTHNNVFVCDWEYNTDLFRPDTITRMAEHFQILLEGVVNNPAQSISQLPLLTAAETQQLLAFHQMETSTSSTTDYANEQTLVDLFQAQVEKTPDNIAVVFENQQLSYQELNFKSNQVAHYLLNLKNDIDNSSQNPSNALVGICVERSLEMLIGLLGILKAGSAYVPLDPTYPQERLQFMLEDSAVPVLLSQSHLLSLLPILTAKVVCLDSEWENMATYSGSNPNRQRIDNLAYVIYTSGSTGMPKGVMVEHSAITQHINYAISRYKIESSDNVLQFASMSFDTSIEQIFSTLCGGARLVLLSTNLLSAKAVQQIISQEKITIADLPPAYWQQLLHEANNPIESLKLLILGGDALSSQLAQETRQILASDVTLLNAYGPTEALITATLFEVSEGYQDNHSEKVTAIGQPIANTQIYILDPHHNLTPLGLPGELCIGGNGLARGYLGSPKLTAEKFIEIDLFGKPQRIYKTGDLARWLPDGNLEYLGRLDDQISLRGFRIELGEIEGVLQQHPDVQEAVVTYNTDKKLLNAYLTRVPKVELWPSVGEYNIYDELLYMAMTTDKARNQHYLEAFQTALPGKTVVEIGPGADMVLTRMALKSGAKKIYAIEWLESAYQEAQKTVNRLGIADKVTLIHGDATQVQLPEKVDFCISELLGMIGGSEGAATIINNARRFLKNEHNMIPQRSVTYIAAISLPENQFDYSFNEMTAHYTQQIFQKVGYPFDLRLCLKNFPLRDIISNTAVFEDLDYTQPVLLEADHEIRLIFNQDSLFNGFLVWLTLQTDEQHTLNVLTENTAWLPVYFPLFVAGQAVKKGDILHAKITRRPSEEYGLFPDYLVEGELERHGFTSEPICYHSYYCKPHYRQLPFYQKLFAEETIPIVQAFNTHSLRNDLLKCLPDYMVPSFFTVLDKLPLTANGKIDRKALPAPETFSSHKHYQAPRGKLELELVQIWENVLNVRPIGVFDNFFELGGHSLLAVRLMAQIEQQFNQHLPLATLFQGATIEQLAIHLRQPTDTEVWSPLVPIQPKGDKTPLFCVHPGGGHVLCYFELAQHLGAEQPFYGLQAFGMEASQKPKTTVEEMATDYLNVLQTVQKQGPYQLVGWSFGGVVAFEMARQLQAQGESVSFLGLLDTVTPAWFADNPKESEANEAQLLVDLFAETNLALSVEQLQPLNLDEQLNYVIAQGQQANLFSPEVKPAHIKRLLDVYQANRKAFQRYQSQVYHGKLTVFSATDRQDQLSPESSLGWEKFTTKAVESYPVPGNHYNMVRSPNVQALAKQLKRCLEQIHN